MICLSRFEIFSDDLATAEDLDNYFSTAGLTRLLSWWDSSFSAGGIIALMLLLHAVVDELVHMLVLSFSTD